MAKEDAYAFKDAIIDTMKGVLPHPYLLFRQKETPKDQTMQNPDNNNADKTEPAEGNTPNADKTEPAEGNTPNDDKIEPAEGNTNPTASIGFRLYKIAKRFKGFNFYKDIEKWCEIPEE